MREPSPTISDGAASRDAAAVESPGTADRRQRCTFLDRHLANLPISKKLGLIVAVFLVIIGALLGVSHFGLSALSDVRAYVGGEGLWSKAQKDAVYHLMRYAIFREPEDYRQYLTDLIVPLGDHTARLALEQRATEYAVAQQAFIEGRNHPQDVAGMARLFTRFHFVSYIRDAGVAWREADQLINELTVVGHDVRRYVRSGEPDNRKVKELLQRIDSINTKLTPIEDRFSYTLGEGARWLKSLLLGVMLALTGLLLALGLWIALSITRHLAGEIERLRRAASRIAEGDFSHPVDVESTDEIGDLAGSFQQMAAQRQQAETALARRAKELDEANRRLIETERAKDTFFATVSHELRTPLTLVLSPLESLLSGAQGAMTEAQRALLQTMHNNTARLLQMVTGLLDFSKLEAGRMEVHRQPTRVVAMTRAMVNDFGALMAEKRLTSHFDARPADVTVHLDRYLYERIVFNLLSNAVKFTPSGGQITVRVAWANNRLRLVVRDTGIGISADDMGQLFKKFHQLEAAATRRFEGTGLGLALVKEFATLLGGTISVDSVPGAGSTFTVECDAPVGEASAATEALTPAASRLIRRFVLPDDAGEATLTSAGPELPKIVVAEDNVELALYIAGLLRPTCQVALAHDGEKALQLVRVWRPDAVISDVMMPQRDGLSLCRAIKADPETTGIPVILLTALTYRDALLKGWEAGADEYLFKPFHPQELVTRMTSVLANLQRRRRVEEERSRIFNLSLDLLCIMDFDGYFKQLNPQWERILGFSAQELSARPYVDFVHPQDQDVTRAEAERLAAGRPTLTFENRFLCKDGTYRWLLWNAVSLPRERRIYAAARDITGRMHAEQQLKRAHTDLKKSHEELKTAHLQLIQSAKLESVGRLAAGVAHEVKNPLAVILQGVDYLSRHLDTSNGNSKTPIVLRHTEAAVRRADAVIRGLLDFSTTRRLELAHADLNAVIGASLLLVKHEGDRGHVHVERKLSDALPPVFVDRNKLEQVFVNLFMNAIHAMPDGGTLTVATHAHQLTEIGEDIGERQQDRFHLGETVVAATIEDTGTGIPEDALQKIFDPFFTTKPTGKGTGLGLTVVKKIIELHNGAITVRNRPEGGVKVTLLLKTHEGTPNGHAPAEDASARD